MPAALCGSCLRRPEILQQQRQSFVQLQSVSGGVGEEESALSNKESSLDSRTASRLFSISISFVRLSLSCARLCHSFSRLSLSCARLCHSFSRLSLSSTLICASTVGCQFNFANQRRHGGKEERNSELLINFEVEESEEIDMAVGGEKSDQDEQQARRQGNPARQVQRCVVCRSLGAGLCREGHEISRASRQVIPLIIQAYCRGIARVRLLFRICAWRSLVIGGTDHASGMNRSTMAFSCLRAATAPAPPGFPRPSAPLAAPPPGPPRFGR
jgi:hypothetical protein